MAKKPLGTIKSRLRRLGIRHFDEIIHDQDTDWLLRNFSSGSRDYPVNVSALIRNIIWQTRERVMRKKREPMRELVRTFWYSHIKPTLARARSLSQKTDQYSNLVDLLVEMVKERQVMEYKDIGFRDDNRANRKVGLNANVILFSEKLGHGDFLDEVADKYQISTIALGGQPSVMNVEYFVDDLKASGIDIRRSFFLFSIVDYDTSGWIIRNAFMEDLRRYGIKNMRNTDLIFPDMLSPKEIEFSRYPIRDGEASAKKNTAWLREIRRRKYKNQIYLEPEIRWKKRTLYGLEAESISGKRIVEKLDVFLPPLLSKDERLVRIMMLEKLNQNVKDLLLFQLT